MSGCTENIEAAIGSPQCLRQSTTRMQMLSQQLWVAQPAALLRRTSASRPGETITEPAAAFIFVALPHCQLGLSKHCRGCHAMVNKARSHTELRLCSTKNFYFKALVVKTNQQKPMTIL